MVSVKKLALALALQAQKDSPSSNSATQQQFLQTSLDNFNVLRSTGGNGPYIQHLGYGIDTNVPDQCSVDQVALLSRHGNRYPTEDNGDQYNTTINKIQSSGVKLQGSLQFLTDYVYYIDNANLYSTETTSGPYSGVTAAQDTGRFLKSNYGQLWDNSSQLTFFASSSDRVVATAKNAATGFFGQENDPNFNLLVLQESKTLGANTLTPDNACKNFNSDYNKDYHQDFKATLFPQVATRLEGESPGLSLDPDDVESLFALCGFELNAKPSSDFCNIFTPDEWVLYDTFRDLHYYYNNGPGNPLSQAIGSVYLNATTTLFNQGPKKAGGALFFSFAHDTQLNFVYSTLGLFDPTEDLPNDSVLFGNPFRSSQLTPMAGRIIFERLNCGGDSYVRINVNDAIIPINSCQDGPGFSCGLSDFTKFANKRVQNYAKQCNLKSSYPQYLSFFWDKKTPAS